MCDICNVFLLALWRSASPVLHALKTVLFPAGNAVDGAKMNLVCIPCAHQRCFTDPYRHVDAFSLQCHEPATASSCRSVFSCLFACLFRRIFTSKTFAPYSASIGCTQPPCVLGERVDVLRGPVKAHAIASDRAPPAGGCPTPAPHTRVIVASFLDFGTRRPRCLALSPAEW